MLSWIALCCIAGALALLLALAVIDLRTRLLPNGLVLGFALLGIVFHICTMAHFVAPVDIALGAAEGFGSLYLLRAAANYWYQTDALGLGDVKLMGAAGLWLGPDGVMAGMAAGALIGCLHGLAVAFINAKKTGAGLNLGQLALPAGPGFACGIILAGLWKFESFRPVLFWEHA